MKVRLYRGPHDGKVMMVRDHETFIVFQEAPQINWNSKTDVTSAIIGLEKTNYRKTGHTHPDGSVYFEWDRPRGTRTGRRKPKPKKVIQSQVPGIYITGGAMSTTSISSGYTITAP